MLLDLACVLKILKKNVVGPMCRVALIECKINVLAFEKKETILYIDFIFSERCAFCVIAMLWCVCMAEKVDCDCLDS